jgi:hypothetical protein
LRCNATTAQRALAVTVERTYVRLSLIIRYNEAYSEAAMVDVKFVQKNGSEQNVEIGENVSVMLAAVRSGIRGIFIPEVQS